MIQDSYVRREAGEVIPVILPAGQCVIWTCREPDVTDHYCTGHLRELRRGRGRATRQAPPCTSPGCDRESHARGLCKAHYNEVYNAARRVKRASARGEAA